jgi:hypothetical protein
MRREALPGLLVLCCAVAACGAGAQAPKASDAQKVTDGLRAVVQLRDEPADIQKTTERLSSIAGVPVREMQAISPRTYALTLVCADASRCDGGLQRLAGATDFVVEARADVRRSIPKPVSASSPSAR